MLGIVGFTWGLTLQEAQSIVMIFDGPRIWNLVAKISRTCFKDSQAQPFLIDSALDGRTTLKI